MSPYRLTVSAWNDLDEIDKYLMVEAGERIAARFEEEFFSTFAKLADYPGIGHSRLDLTSRSAAFFTVDPYLVIYARDVTPITIFAILHGARDVKRILRHRPL